MKTRDQTAQDGQSRDTQESQKTFQETRCWLFDCGLDFLFLSAFGDRTSSQRLQHIQKFLAVFGLLHVIAREERIEVVHHMERLGSEFIRIGQKECDAGRLIRQLADL